MKIKRSVGEKQNMISLWIDAAALGRDYICAESDNPFPQSEGNILLSRLLSLVGETLIRGTSIDSNVSENAPCLLYPLIVEQVINALA